ncbi:MAG: DUF4910 domain-containing protein, partial [bacterium]|nr:DUF4910 domain-containing protein [bacterium]
IDSTFSDGTLKVGEIFIPGSSGREIILIAHLCHPCQVDDDLTGVVALLSLSEKLRKHKNHYSYRILIVPETIGTIAHLANNDEILESADFGICLGSLGNKNNLSLQQSRTGHSMLDLAAKNVLRETSIIHRVGKFGEVIGNDEKVLESPGVSIPTISLTRCQPWLEGRPFPEYHSSLDTPEKITLERIIEVEDIVEKILMQLNSNFYPIPKFKGPIYLTPLNLWIDPRKDPQYLIKINELMQLLHEDDLSMIEIANRLEISYSLLMEWVDTFEKNELLSRKAIE